MSIPTSKESTPSIEQNVKIEIENSPPPNTMDSVTPDEIP
jgi:hypothetical protein